MSPNMAEWEEWVIVPADVHKKDRVGFRSYWNKFLSAQLFNKVKQANHLKDWEKWNVKYVNNKLAFTGHHKKNLRAGEKGEVNQTNVLEAWELWQVIPKRRR
eukprot:TRINITY_DN6955_c1_g1_i6.p1 TRINITY_DN6955_c1_g1~~TRINITY_DN6955_c1_g1_i6.p1  ORF type:complete len:102 (+),score=32.61 TRINITY_DN6955_c1_g1_i6:181-486(+)